MLLDRRDVATLNIMSKKSLANSCIRLLSDLYYFAIPLLMLGFVPGVWAQPATNTWDTTISFSGSGNLAVSATSYAVTGVADPFLTVSMTGSGVNTADADGLGGFHINSSFNAIASITMPNTIPAGISPFSITAPRTGSDHGLTFTAPQTDIASAGGSPFYGLFPPPAGSEYASSDANAAQYFFQYDPTTQLFVKFNGPLSLTLGETPTLTVTPDLSLPGNDFYSYSYADSVLDLSATIGENDPDLKFTGAAVITTIAAAPAPDSSPGLVGVLAPLAVCVGGVWKKTRQRGETSVHSCAFLH
jgi:hypothetical protein